MNTPTTKRLIQKLCLVAAGLPGHTNYERMSLDDVFKTTLGDEFDRQAALDLLSDAREHAFSRGWIEERPESYLVEACYRILMITSK